MTVAIMTTTLGTLFLKIFSVARIIVYIVAKRMWKQSTFLSDEEIINASVACGALVHGQKQTRLKMLKALAIRAVYEKRTRGVATGRSEPISVTGALVAQLRMVKKKPCDETTTHAGTAYGTTQYWSTFLNSLTSLQRTMISKDELADLRKTLVDKSRSFMKGPVVHLINLLMSLPEHR